MELLINTIKIIGVAAFGIVEHLNIYNDKVNADADLCMFHLFSLLFLTFKRFIQRNSSETQMN